MRSPFDPPRPRGFRQAVAFVETALRETGTRIIRSESVPVRAGPMESLVKEDAEQAKRAIAALLRGEEPEDVPTLLRTDDEVLADLVARVAIAGELGSISNEQRAMADRIDTVFRRARLEGDKNDPIGALTLLTVLRITGVVEARRVDQYDLVAHLESSVCGAASAHEKTALQLCALLLGHAGVARRVFPLESAPAELEPQIATCLLHGSDHADALRRYVASLEPAVRTRALRYDLLLLFYCARLQANAACWRLPTTNDLLCAPW